jgi:hypothetical protein
MNSWIKTNGIELNSPKRYSVTLFRMSSIPKLMELKTDVTSGEEVAVGKVVLYRGKILYGATIYTT